MSAIFGIINKKNIPVTEHTVNLMQVTLQHRATDGSGVYYENNVFLGNNQLATSVYQKNEALPYQEDDYIITVDARIDNRSELISLLGLSQKLAETSDSVLILKAYKKWGDKCTNHLEGEFTFVIFNKTEQTLFAATDHIGIRSFYYYLSPEGFIFSSELKSILAVKKPPHHFNEKIIADLITTNHNGTTIDKDINILNAASHLYYDNHTSKPVIQKYWELKKRGKYRFTKDADWVNCLKELLTQSVKNRLITDKPIGLSLSGGLDSSFLAGIIASELKKQNKPLYTFSYVLPNGHQGPEKDETYFINKMVHFYDNICPTFVQLPPEVGPFTNLSDIFERTETLCYPFIYIDKALYAAAMDKKIGTIFTGFGGDFTISNKGNSMVYEMIRAGDFKKGFYYFLQLKQRHNLSYLRGLKYLIADYSWLMQFYGPVIQLFKPNDQIPPLNKSLFALVSSKKSWGTGKAVKTGIVEIINSGTMGGALFNTQKKLSASYNMECTAPILDKNINEFFLDIPPEQFLLNNTDRSLMRRAMDNITPSEIQWRKDKAPFNPDFFRRFKQQKTEIEYFLSDTKFKSAHKYLDVEKTKTKVAQLFNQDISSVIPDLSRNTAYAIELVLFVDWLKSKEFIF